MQYLENLLQLRDFVDSHVVSHWPGLWNNLGRYSKDHGRSLRGNRGLQPLSGQTQCCMSCRDSMAPTITTASIYMSPNSYAGIVFPGTQKDTRTSASQRSLLVNHISTSVKHPKITKKQSHLNLDTLTSHPKISQLIIFHDYLTLL